MKKADITAGALKQVREADDAATLCSGLYLCNPTVYFHVRSKFSVRWSILYR